jgi:hypothetical protein
MSSWLIGHFGGAQKIARIAFSLRRQPRNPEGIGNNEPS